jgi:hypothetical protein
MGKIIRLRPEDIRPTQPYLTEESLCYFFQKHLKGEGEKLIPPAVRYHRKRKEYLTLDGHNTIAAAQIFDKDLPVYVARHKYDFMSWLRFPKADKPSLKVRNILIHLRFYKILEDIVELDEQDIPDFKNLLATHAPLDDLDAALEYFSIYECDERDTSGIGQNIEWWYNRIF